MTFDEILKSVKSEGKRRVALADKDNGLSLQIGGIPVPWPEDWPETITGEFLTEKGFEVLSQ